MRLPLTTCLAVGIAMACIHALQAADDLKDIDLSKHGIELVKPTKDPKTGFVVGGRNETNLIKKITELASRPIVDLERDMRPGAHGEGGSDAGFLGKDEGLLKVLADDNRFVVEQKGLTHQELARHLHAFAVIAELHRDQEVLYHGRRYCTKLAAWRGYQESPFQDGTRTNIDVTVENVETGKKLTYSGLVPYMIDRYGFYEGKGTPYRVDPAVVLEVFDFLTAQRQTAEIIEARKIWDAAPHNAFTDLIRFRDHWLCVFREGATHVSPDGAIRVISSADGERWESAFLLTSKTSDLRDPKITITPDGRLMLTGAEAVTVPGGKAHQSLVWFSTDGLNWSDRTEIGLRDEWLWRTTWNKRVAYSVGYGCRSDNKLVNLYHSQDGKDFQPLVAPLHAEGYPNESSLVFMDDDTCYCLLRRDGKPNSGLLGTSKPPYKHWAWKDLGVQIGGPRMIRIANGRLIAAVRLYDGAVRTSVCEVDASTGKLTELAKLPSGGDTSYAGLVWHDDLLWVSYYSSHEAKTSIYLAKLRLDAVR